MTWHFPMRYVSPAFLHVPEDYAYRYKEAHYGQRA